MSPSSGKGMRPEAVSVRLGVHLKKVIFPLNQYAAVDARWVNAEEDGWWHRGVSPRFSHQSSCWLRSLRCQQPSHKRPVYVFHSLLHAAARLKWRYRFSHFQMWRWDHLTNPGLLVIWKFAWDQKSHSMVRIHSPVLSQQQSNTVQNRGLDIQQTKRIEKWLII